jgi:hypothetical protein
MHAVRLCYRKKYEIAQQKHFAIIQLLFAISKCI